jgi:hypothetical protein
MASNRSSERTRTEEHERELGTTQLREQTPRSESAGTASGQDPAAARFDGDDEAAKRAAQQAAIVEQRQLAERNVRMARSPGAMGPLGRNVLLIAALVLVALVGIWALLSL